jgi:hypothetical protein
MAAPYQLGKQMNDATLVVRKLTQTCFACPSQWEAILDDGRMAYFRYRWGNLSIRVSDKPTEDVMDAAGGKEVFNMNLGGEWDGVLEEREMRAQTKNIISYEIG